MRSGALCLGLLVALAAWGCEDRRQKAIEAIDQDTEILRGVNGTVNAVLRNQADCQAARPLMEEAYQRIDDAHERVAAPASKQTLEMLKAQVDRIGQACP